MVVPIILTEYLIHIHVGENFRQAKLSPSQLATFALQKYSVE